MHFIPILLSLGVASTCHAWARDGNGNWVAHNTKHTFSTGARHELPGPKHEACTYMNTQNLRNPGDGCSYWVDGNGRIFNGACDFSYAFEGGKVTYVDCK